MAMKLIFFFSVSICMNGIGCSGWCRQLSEQVIRRKRKIMFSLVSPLATMMLSNIMCMFNRSPLNRITTAKNKREPRNMRLRTWRRLEFMLCECQMTSFRVWRQHFRFIFVRRQIGRIGRTQRIIAFDPAGRRAIYFHFFINLRVKIKTNIMFEPRIREIVFQFRSIAKDGCLCCGCHIRMAWECFNLINFCLVSFRSDSG